MTELLKVLKFLFKRAKNRAFKVMSRFTSRSSSEAVSGIMWKIRHYKGLYAFLGGVMVFSLCFAGKGNSNVFAYNGSYTALFLPAAEMVSVNSEISENQPVSSADAGALLSLSELPKENARRVPYNVFQNDNGNILGTIDGISAETDTEDENALEKARARETSEETAAETVPEKEEVQEPSTENAPDSAPEKEKDEETSAEEAQDSAPNTEEPKEESYIKYINTDLIYSRKEAKEGSEKLNRYRINDPVEVCGLTDTHYYRLTSGEFIHEDYLSDEESPKWTETEAEGLMYIRNGGIYSREEALEGSAKVNKYNLNDTVTVTAVTNTNYYKIAEGEFIHADYLSPQEVTDYPLDTRYGQREQTVTEKELAQQVFEVVNAVRADYGLAPYKQLDGLTAAAAERAWEASVNMSHTRPDGTRCFTVLDEYGLSSPSSKGENLAKWYSSAQAVVNAWMNDYAHRTAILGNYEYMGVGCYYISSDYYGYYWTQVFYTP